MESDQAEVATKRVVVNKMGLLGAISYILSNIVGSGIFIAPTSILEKAGSPGFSLVIWAVSAIISIFGSFCYVELGTSIRSSGADYAYLCYVRWFPVAFAFMCAGCILSYPVTVAIQAQTFSEYIFKGFRLEVPNDFSGYFAKKLLGFALIWLIMFMNFFSLKKCVSRFQMVASLAKVLSTAIIIVTGFYFLFVKGETKNLSNPFKDSAFDVGNIVLALYAGLFTYDGWDILNFGAEEIEKPKRTMPLAIVIGMFIVAAIYITSNIAYFVVLDVDQILSSEAVASTFAAEKLGSFQYAVPFLICILLIGSINSSVFAASRYLHAAAREGHLPTFISCTNQESDSPRVALFVNILISMAMSFAGDLNTLISYIGFTQWAQRLCTMAVLLWIRFRKIPTHPDSIRTPIILPIVFFLICLILCVVTIVESFKIAAIGLGTMAAGLVVYFLFVYEKSLPALQWYQKFSATLNNSTTMIAQIIFNGMPERFEQIDERATVAKLVKEQQKKANLASEATVVKEPKRWFRNRKNCAAVIRPTIGPLKKFDNVS